MKYGRTFVAAMAVFAPCLACALTVDPLPKDMCPLDAKVPEQAAMISYFTGSAVGSTVVASFASCDELEAIAKKKATAVSHYGYVLQQPAPADLTMDRTSYLATVATTFASAGALTSTALAMVPAATAQGRLPVGVAAPSDIGVTSKGVLYQDPRMVIIGMEQNNQFGTATTRVASTAGITMIGGQPVSVNLYAPLTDKDAFASATEALKPVINAMIRNNR